MINNAIGPTDTLILTNLTKVFWPESGHTKRDLIDYYREIAPVILPHLQDRPQVLHRHVDGHTGKEFFQRVSRTCPDWMKLVRISMEGGKRVRDYHLCQDWPTLLWLANFGCIEFIPWGSRVGSLDRPDYMVIDLDPQDVPVTTTVTVALEVRRILDKIGAESVCKTSGKRGLHIYVPFGKKYTFGQAKMLSELLAVLVNRTLPGATSLDARPEHRKNRIYLDTTRNARGQAVAAPYSARPHPGATVSAPLKWSEVGRKLDAARFTIKTMPGRVEKVADLWRPVLGPGIDLGACLQRLEKVCR
jgi:bifunctional non-homologous end joining protein LigD